MSASDIKGGRGYRPGMIVDHPKRPQWGPGKVLAVAGKEVTVYFRDVEESSPGEALKTIRVDYVSLAASDLKSDPQLDNLPPFDGVGFGNKRVRLTMEQSIERFLRRYPRAFQDPEYIGDLKTGERAYKLAAHESYVETLGGETGPALLAQGQIDELVRRLLAVEGAVNLLSPYEKMALRESLQDEAAARGLLTALFALVGKADLQEQSFSALATAVGRLPADPGRARVATWPVLTLFPFLAQPTIYMCLKPEVTLECAARLNFELNYKSDLNWLTYRSLMTMAEMLLSRLRQHGARDFIDVQSFIWLIGSPDSEL